MTRKEKKEELIGLFCTGAIFIGDLIDECFDFGQQHPHWISVADELPPRWEKYPHLSKNVLCSDGVNVMVNYYDYNEAEWTYGVGMSHITHWMPMPQPLVVSKMENTEKKGGEQ